MKKTYIIPSVKTHKVGSRIDLLQTNALGASKATETQFMLGKERVVDDTPSANSDFENTSLWGSLED